MQTDRFIFICRSVEGLGIHPLLRQGWGLKNEMDAFCRLQSAGRDASWRELTEILHESYVAMLHNVLQSLSSLLSLVSKQLIFCSLYCCCINLFRNNIKLCLFWICSAKARALYHPALTTLVTTAESWSWTLRSHPCVRVPQHEFSLAGLTTFDSRPCKWNECFPLLQDEKVHIWSLDRLTLKHFTAHTREHRF